MGKGHFLQIYVSQRWVITWDTVVGSQIWHRIRILHRRITPHNQIILKFARFDSFVTLWIFAMYKKNRFSQIKNSQGRNWKIGLDVSTLRHMGYPTQKEFWKSIEPLLRSRADAHADTFWLFDRYCTNHETFYFVNFVYFEKSFDNCYNDAVRRAIVVFAP